MAQTSTLALLNTCRDSTSRNGMCSLHAFYKRKHWGTTNFKTAAWGKKFSCAQRKSPMQTFHGFEVNQLGSFCPALPTPRKLRDFSTDGFFFKKRCCAIKHSLNRLKEPQNATLPKKNDAGQAGSHFHHLTDYINRLYLRFWLGVGAVSYF